MKICINMNQRKEDGAPRLRDRVSGLLWLLLAAGCSTPAIMSYRVPQGPTEDQPNPPPGIAYSLPLGKIHFVATRVDTVVTNGPAWVTNEFFTNTFTSTSIVTNNAARLSAPSASTNENHFTNTAVATSVFTNSLTTLTTQTNPTGTRTPQETNTTQYGTLVTNTSTVVSTYSNSPASRAPQETITNNWSATTIRMTQGRLDVTTNYSYTVVVEEKYEPDPDQLYTLQPHGGFGDWFYDDTLAISVSTNQLLYSVNATNTDHTGDVLVELAKAAVQGFQLAAGFPNFEGKTSVTNKSIPPKVIDVTFNPFVKKDRKAAKQALESGGLTIEFDSFITGKTNRYEGWLTDTNNSHVGGIYYRALLPYTITFKDHQRIAQMRTVLLPNKSPVLALEVRKYCLVSTVNQVTLTNGIVTGLYLNKQSQAYAASKIPIQIINSLASVPTNLLQLKFDISSGKTKLQNQQTNEINSSIALLSAQARLLEAQNAARTNSAAK